ncbi:MAG TPA: hypothetical protein VFV75_12310 [Candidatus Polarisedimenticolaceae bacterium]|nr:hypothetical protein [Candidatus Polarisedimenticolaceae bacterium]
MRFEGTGTSTGPVLLEVPDPGALHGYLVVGVGTGLEGPAGDATAGPRTVNALGACPVRAILS